MATLIPADDDILTFGKKTGRVFAPRCPGVRPLMTIRHGDVAKPQFFLGNAKSSVCGEDRRARRDVRRSAFGMEPDQFKPWLGKRREVNFNLIVIPGEPIEQFRWEFDAAGRFVRTNVQAYMELWQWMGLRIPGTSAFDTSPQATIGFVQMGEQLCLRFTTHTAVLPNTKNYVPWRAIEMAPPYPIERAQPLAIKAEFQDGFGGTGSFKSTVNGKLVCDYVGPAGFKDHGNLYGGLQLYSSNSPVETRVRVADLSEGPVGAMENTW